MPTYILDVTEVNVYRVKVVASDWHDARDKAHCMLLLNRKGANVRLESSEFSRYEQVNKGDE